MDSNEAQQILFEVLEVLEGSALDRYSLAEVKKDTTQSSGYSVIIGAFLGSISKRQICDIAKKHGLRNKRRKRRTYSLQTSQQISCNNLSLKTHTGFVFKIQMWKVEKCQENLR